jgi:hypothetical protein
MSCGLRNGGRREVEDARKQFYDDVMTIQIDVAQLGPALVEDLSQNGGEITLTRDGKPIAKLVRVESAREATVAKQHDNLDWDEDGPLAGSILYEGDIVSPLDEEWEADK